MFNKITFQTDIGYYELSDENDNKIGSCQSMQIVLTRHSTKQGPRIVDTFYSNFFLDSINLQNCTVDDNKFRFWLNDTLLRDVENALPIVKVRSLHLNFDLTKAQLIDYPSANIKVGTNFRDLYIVAGISGGNLAQTMEFLNKNYTWNKQKLSEILSKKG